ncbi:uncharacterized protein LOC111918865 [Lactuca sativa]|uniref:uncharacterized protein LOC111918865 n=1 Tax=Lactuca sativa TaxID=4236 RepID=UPI000CD94904|nr:uncharacterized protein LOC111918865 [Lactuca sativa]
MEGLSIAVKSAYQQSLFKGIQLPNNGPCLTHLLYVDDAIFIGKWDKGCIKNLARILKCFHISSGLKVNFHKSRLFGIRVTEDELEEQAKILGCLKGVFPFSYLGVPVGANLSQKKNWRPIIEKFQSRLSLWKAKTLSFAGRLTLVKSVLNSLPTYYFSLFRAPHGVIEDLEKLRRKFLWGGDDSRKIHWVSWPKIIMDKKEGGLGVGSLMAQNLALLTKWFWRLKIEPRSLWKECIMSIHNLSRKPFNYMVKQSIRGVWCNISKAIKSLHDVNTNCHSLFSPVPGTNTQFLFWLDHWCGSNIFKNKFPLLYELESVKKCYVTERVANESFTWSWKSSLRGEAVLSEFVEICSILNNIRLTPVSLGLKFNLNLDGMYTVNMMRRCIDATGIPHNGLIVEWSRIIPLKVKCFV